MTLLLTAGAACSGDAPRWRPTSELIRHDAVWTWFHDPRAIRSGDATYMTWNATDGVYVGELNHRTGEFGAFRLRETPAGRPTDDHNVAAIGIREDGRLIAAYSDHNDTDMRVRISTSPRDVTNWGTEQSVAKGTVTYPNLVYLAAEQRWYLFYRQDSGYYGRPPAFVSSDDNGATWSAEQPLTTTLTDERPYLKVVSDGVAHMHFLITNKHPQRGDASVYHFSYDIRSGPHGTPVGAWHNSSGQNLGALPIDHAEMTLVNDGTVVNSWVWDIALDGPDPVIAYTTFPSETDHRYNYGRLVDGTWQTHEITQGGGTLDGDTEPLYSGGLMLNHADPSIAYVSRQVGRGQWDLERWITGDIGATWSSWTIASDGKHMRPVSVRGDGPEAIIWFAGSYTHYNTFATDLYYAEVGTP